MAFHLLSLDNLVCKQIKEIAGCCGNTMCSFPMAHPSMEAMSDHVDSTIKEADFRPPVLFAS